MRNGNATSPSTSIRNRTFKISFVATRRNKYDIAMIYKIICGENYLQVISSAGCPLLAQELAHFDTIFYSEALRPTTFYTES